MELLIAPHMGGKLTESQAALNILVALSYWIMGANMGAGGGEGGGIVLRGREDGN